ncbi:MAG TPA: glycosyltransferase [Gammaproteobacteria bacterium]|nr:glycosyltransferase [Gammaproteobacteria bacterium]
MRIVMFYHSLVSDWNHGNAHFLRGIATELIERGHNVCVYEPANGWSLRHLRQQRGNAAIAAFHQHYPRLKTHFYEPDRVDLERALDGADLVLVHEWNDPALIGRIGQHRARHRYRLLFHDTHHRSVSDAAGIARCKLDDYDGVLAFGEAIRQRYLDAGWARHVWTWHEAADTRVFKPLPDEPRERDVVWIGNWGDGERDRELNEFLLQPAAALKLSATIHGVRYPRPVLRKLNAAGFDYRGWLPNFDAPRAYARHRVTVHVPRRPYARALPGIPTIRMFEALACGIPLVSAPWQDCEHLFTPGEDYLVAKNGAEMRNHLRTILNEPERAAALAAHGRRTILARHTCAHRADELLAPVTPQTEEIPDALSLRKRVG